MQTNLLPRFEEDESTTRTAEVTRFEMTQHTGVYCLTLYDYVTQLLRKSFGIESRDLCSMILIQRSSGLETYEYQTLYCIPYICMYVYVYIYIHIHTCTHTERDMNLAPTTVVLPSNLVGSP